MLMTTLAAIRAAKPCSDGYAKAATHLGGVRKFGAKTAFPVASILNSNGIADTCWVLGEVCGETGWMILGLWAAQQSDEQESTPFQDGYEAGMIAAAEAVRTQAKVMLRYRSATTPAAAAQVGAQLAGRVEKCDCGCGGVAIALEVIKGAARSASYRDGVVAAANWLAADGSPRISGDMVAALLPADAAPPTSGAGDEGDGR